jgi:hypothetical protein
MAKRKLPPDPERMNVQYADMAFSTLEYFASAHGEVGPDLDEQNITDLLGDLGHYCDRAGLDLSACWRRAAMHYGEETSHQGAQFTEGN